jgi:hypothetical protein
MKKEVVLVASCFLFFSSVNASSLLCAYNYDGSNTIASGYKNTYSNEYARGQLNRYQNGEYKGRGVSTYVPFVYHEKIKNGRKSDFATYDVRINPRIKRTALPPLDRWSVLEFKSVKVKDFKNFTVGKEFLHTYKVNFRNKTIKIIDSNTNRVLVENIPVNCEIR